MRRALPASVAAIALVAATPVAAEAMEAGEPAVVTVLTGWKPDVAAARTYARSRTGTVAFSVRAKGVRAGLRAHARYSSASVVKAMLLVAHLRQPTVRRRALAPGERDMLAAMIRWSSNDDASLAFATVGPLALPALARRAGMRHFAGSAWWGASQITADDQARFFLRLHRLLPSRHRGFAMGLLRGIIPAQRWGVARVRPRGWSLYFKGGWTTTVEHQVALLTHRGERVAVAVLTSGSPDPAYGRATQEGVFRRLLRGLEEELRARWLGGAPAGASRPT